VTDDLRRRARSMAVARAVVAVLVPLEMLLYEPPPGIASQLHPVRASAWVVAVLVATTAGSLWRHHTCTDAAVLRRCGRLELTLDALVALGVLQAFSFDQVSSIWTILVVIALEGAFREGLRGALLAWAGCSAVHLAIQLVAHQRYPDSGGAGAGSLIFRALVPGLVALVAGSLASQLQAAVERHRASETLLAEQYDDLRLIGRVSRAIAAGPEARREVCRAVAELTGAELVMLYEPEDDLLHCTAAAGCANRLMPPLALGDATSGIVRAYRTGVQQLVPDAVLPEAFARTAPVLRTRSAVFVPVVRDGVTVAAMGLTFAVRTDALTPRVAAALEVLAEEAAVAIMRADLTESLASEARRDQLTGLVNRRGMEEALETELQRARRTGSPLTVLMLDLDGLKVFNDTYGHLAGDRLIAAAAAGWRSRLRPTDVLARYGGDEFVAVLPGCDEGRALRVADAMLAALPPGARCSVGAALWDLRESADELLSRADAALYRGKRAGGGRAVPAVPTQRASSTRTA
jgi:diguanylate cyclase (GGDEF)-like protein